MSKQLIFHSSDVMRLPKFAAFAVEGQVKEKSRWFSSLRDLMRKVKVLIF